MRTITLSDVEKFRQQEIKDHEAYMSICKHTRSRIDRIRECNNISYPTLIFKVSDIVGRRVKDLGELTGTELKRVEKELKNGSRK